MPRIRSQEPEGRLTTGGEPEPNNLIPSTQSSLRGIRSRGLRSRRTSRRGGLAQEEAAPPSAFQRIQGHYEENQQVYNVSGAVLGGFVLGMLVS